VEAPEAPPEAPLFTDIAEGPPGGRALWLRAADGVRLRAGLWATAPRGTVLLFPGRTEVIEKYGPVARDLAAAGWGTLTLDWRGQGLSDRLGPDPSLGHVARFADYQRDVAALTEAAQRLALPRPWVLLAHSMGGCIGLRALTEGLPVAAAGFAAPMWGLSLPAHSRLAVRAAGRLGRLGHRPVPGERSDFALADTSFDDNMVTTDAGRFSFMQAQVLRHPELALGAPTLGWLAAALSEMAALARLPSPALPVHTAVGSREKIVDPAAIAARMARWPGAGFDTLPGAEHELMMEADAHRNRFLAAVLALFDSARA